MPGSLPVFFTHAGDITFSHMSILPYYTAALTGGVQFTFILRYATHSTTLNSGVPERGL